MPKFDPKFTFGLRRASRDASADASDAAAAPPHETEPLLQANGEIETNGGLRQEEGTYAFLNPEHTAKLPVFRTIHM